MSLKQSDDHENSDLLSYSRGSAFASDAGMLVPTSDDLQQILPAQPKKKRKSKIRTHVDVLSQEYAYHRISDDAYLAGLAYKARIKHLYESSVDNLWSLGTRIDKSRKPDATMIYHMDRSKNLVQMQNETRPVIGLLGERLLMAVLGEGLTLMQAAEKLEESIDISCEKKGKHLTSLYAWHFREALEALSRHWDGWKNRKKLANTV